MFQIDLLPLVIIKVIAALLNIGLLLLILIRTPEKNAGLASFANKSDLFGSPSSTQRFFDNITMIGIIVYLIIVFILDKIIDL